MGYKYEDRKITETRRVVASVTCDSCEEDITGQGLLCLRLSGRYSHKDEDGVERGFRSMADIVLCSKCSTELESVPAMSRALAKVRR